MNEPAPVSIRTGRAARPSREVARVLKAQVRNGTYFTPERVDRAFDRLLARLGEDLPLDA